MTNDVTIVIPTHTTAHYMLQDCVKNIRDTTGLEPFVCEDKGNVSVARNRAMRECSTEWVCFVDTDAFPQGKNWINTLITTTERMGASICQPSEVSEFGQVHVRSECKLSEPLLIDNPTNCAGMCLLVKRADCAGLFDEHCGLTAGFLGPCIEDTDFALHVGHLGLKMVYDPRVEALHKDRGAATLDAWRETDEHAAYRIMNLMLKAKWNSADDSFRAGFFSGIGMVPAKDQRTLADGYGRDDLLACYAPMIERFPEASRAPVQRFLEMTIAGETFGGVFGRDPRLQADCKPPASP